MDAWHKLMNELNDEKSEQNEASEVDSQAGALSDASVESDAEDFFYVKALCKSERKWITTEDRERECIELLASHIREQPHLPRDPTDKKAIRPLVDRALLDAYIELPYAHCMFKGCRWVQQHPCKDRHPPEYYLLMHLQKKHEDIFRSCCGEHSVQRSKFKAEAEYLDYLEEAVKFKAESGDMPEVNGAVDRRTLTYLHTAMGDKDVHAYFCFICAERHVHLRSYDHRRGSKYKGTIEYFTLRNILTAMQCGQNNPNREAFKGKWDANFSWKLFVERYMQPWVREPSTTSEPEHGFVHTSWEWRRRLCLNAAGKLFRSAVCCPEDVDSSSPSCKMQHGQNETDVCLDCKIPVCLECYSHLWKPQKYKIPAALANDNFQGYIHPFIVQHRVRWIEAIVACPYLTTIVQYYVEGHPREKHHLANERMGEHARAYAFRGNVFAYQLPWEMILASAATATSADFLKHWPQPPELVAHLIKAQFVNTTEEHTLGHLKELHIRSFVLVGLARIYIEHGHEDMIKLGMTGEHADVENKKKAALDAYMARVQHLYPSDVAVR